jgi:sugar-specific transcriptional regulator TrmB
MYIKIINKLGLSLVQSELLNALLTSGSDKASNLAKKTKRPRGVAYKGLEELISLKLVSKLDDNKKVSIYSAEHPSYLENIIEQREKDLKREKQEFINNLPELISAYNLVSNKPGFKFYEGESGIIKSLEDTLNSSEEIYTLADLEAVEKNVKEINKEYVKKRNKNKKKKKVIVADTTFNRNYLKKVEDDNIEYRFLPKEFYNFNSGVQIYDNKVSYQIISSDKKMAIVIEDENIYKMNRLLFEYIWEKIK